MEELVGYLEEVYEQWKISFEVYIGDKSIFKADYMHLAQNLVENKFMIGKKQCKIVLDKDHEDSIKLLEFFIKKKFKENHNEKEKIIKSLLDDIYISGERVKEILPEVGKETFLVNIILKDKLSDTFDILKNIYEDSNNIILIYEDSILLVGIFEDIIEHISSISETIYTSIYKKSYISYCHIKDYGMLKDLYNDNIYRINLAKKYNLSVKVLDENSLLFEKIIDDLNQDTRQKIIDKFDCGFSKLDEEIIKTIDVFLNLNLNLSETAKVLYIHRNTLIYRLDKIQKYTSYDIRKFNDATLFKIAFSIWKQKLN